jgi:Flp pilus assembly protein TadG
MNVEEIIMKKNLRFPRSAKGQSLVELAISLVVLLTLLAGAVEFGILFFQYVQLRDAAQEGALYGSTKPDDVTGIVDRAKYSSQSPLDLPTLLSQSGNLGNGEVDVDIKITHGVSEYVPTDAGYADNDCEGDNRSITVTLKYNHRIFMPFMPQLIGENIPLTATVTDTILSPRCP